MAIDFWWNGRPLKANAGDSIAAAISAYGESVFGIDRLGRERTQFCGMGGCQECLVIVNGQRSQRACMTEICSGSKVTAQNDAIASTSVLTELPEQELSFDIDLAIIGAGPAGLSAAIEASACGLSVCLIDERADTGGQYFKPRSEGFRGSSLPDNQHRRGIKLRQQAALSGASLLLGHTVWFARTREDGSGFDLRTQGTAHRARVSARTVILATGAMERPMFVPGWTLPGVMSVGAGQTLARRYGVSAGSQVLVAGHGPLGLQLAAELRQLGVTVVAVVERARPGPGRAFFRAAIASPSLVRDGLTYRLRLLRARVPVLQGWQVSSILGDKKAEGAILRHIYSGKTRIIKADLVCLSDGFMPQTELARLFGVSLSLQPDYGSATPQRALDCSTNVTGLWIAGDAGGLGGAQLASAQGALVGVSSALHLGKPAKLKTSVQDQLKQARRFQSSLWELYSAPPSAVPDDATVLCRCENITAGKVRTAIDAGATDPGAIKRATRLGMGRCQGRYCSAPIARLLSNSGYPVTPETLFAPQIPARPIRAAFLSVEKPEWGGHQEGSPSARPGLSAPQAMTKVSADLVVIGAGITGISASLFAARQGAEVICLDRGRVNGEASGGNAGSLHLQLLSWDFGGKAVSGGSPQLRTLPLQQESISLWSKLQTDMRADFELQITGGLMVAESSDQIQFLENKAASEARAGIHTEVIGKDRIREIMPAISDCVVAAAWCPGEGKINPLIATNELTRAARAEGATINEMTEVTGIQRDGDQYQVETSRGVIIASRVLIAAGGWSAHVARLIDVNLPIRGAPLQMLTTETAPPMIPCLISHADRHLTMKQTKAGTILIGGAWMAATGKNGQPLVLPESLEGNSWVATHTVPSIGGLSIIRSWAAMNIDIDGAPLLGPLPGHPGVFIAATANGYTLGPLIGREAADLCLSKHTKKELEFFSTNRFLT